jgi:small GTP-binding protein
MGASGATSTRSNPIARRRTQPLARNRFVAVIIMAHDGTSQRPTTDAADFVFKTIIIGDSFAGKSSLLQQFVNGKVNQTAKQTVGVEYGSRTLACSSDDSGPAGNKHIAKLQIWDTAGQDKFRAVTRSYYRGAVGCLCVFSLTDRSSFERLGQWLEDARTQACDAVSTVIVGNKLDAAAEARQVTLMEASAFALSQGCAYVETSARTGEGVEVCWGENSPAAKGCMPECLHHPSNAGSIL